VKPTAPIDIDSVMAAAKAGHYEDRFRATARDYAEDDPKDVHQAILATEDDVAEPVGAAVMLALWGGGGRSALRRGPDCATESGAARRSGLCVIATSTAVRNPGRRSSRPGLLAHLLRALSAG